MPRIIVTGDLLRPQDEAFRPAQNGNIQWFHRLVRRPLAAASGLAVEALVWGVDSFDTPGFSSTWAVTAAYAATATVSATTFITSTFVLRR
jgi:hypothetical protein